MTSMVAISIVFLLFGAGIFYFLRRMLTPSTVSVCDPQWISEFSVTKYRPMMRLLDDSDARYLASQATCSSRTLRHLRSERRRIFRSYLRMLVGDFNRLHLSARMLLVGSQTDRPELAALLFRQRMIFCAALMAIEGRLALHTFGLSTVNVSALLETVAAMQGQVTEAAPAGQQAA